MKKRRLGFTLTELIIVIVIIGILAAVMIPSVTGYIKKAKVSKGVQEARELTEVLAAEAIYQDRDYFEAYEIENICKEVDLELVSQLEDYRFWYDAASNQVKYLSMKEAFGSAVSAANSASQNCIEALSSAHPSYRYVDKYDDELTDLVSTIRSLPAKAKEGMSSSDKLNPNTVINKMDELFNRVLNNFSNNKIKGLDNKSSIVNYVAYFDTVNSVYVDDDCMYNKAYISSSVNNALIYDNVNPSSTSGKATITISNVVFTPGIENIPQAGLSTTSTAQNLEVIISQDIIIPDTVNSITINAFTNIVSCQAIVLKADQFNDEILSNGIGEIGTPSRTAISNRGTNINYITLKLGKDVFINYNQAEIRYNNNNTQSYYLDDNKVISLGDDKVYFIDDEFVKTSQDITDEEYLSSYLIPNLTFNNESNDIDFSKIEKVMIKRSLYKNICVYSAVLIDNTLNGYKVESFGYLTDIDWNIKQQFKVTNDSATIEVFLPRYVFNFANFSDAKIAVTITPQVIKTADMMGLDGDVVHVYNGLAMSNHKIVLNINEGVYDSATGMYKYTRTLNGLKSNDDYRVVIDSVSEQCNQITIDEIAIYQGNNFDEQSSKEDNVSQGIQYLFIRKY